MYLEELSEFLEEPKALKLYRNLLQRLYCQVIPKSKSIISFSGFLLPHPDGLHFFQEILSSGRK